MFNCPVDSQNYDTSKKAIVCWKSHYPNLFSLFSLAHIGTKIGVSRERVRQIANSLDVTERKETRKKDAIRGKEAEKTRRKNSIAWRKKNS